MPDETAIKTEVREARLADYWNVLVRRFWIVAVAFAVVFFAIAIYSLTLPDQYEASATFIIDAANTGLGTMFDARSPLLGQQRRPLEFYQALIKSQAYMDLSLQEVRADSSLRKFNLSNESLYYIFKNNVKLLTSAKSELVKISYQSINPEMAYRIAKIAMEAFSMRCRQIELQESSNIVSFVENQKDIAKAKLEDTERSLQEFNNSSNFVVKDEEGGLLNKMINMESQLTEVKGQRELAEANIADYDRRLRELNAPEATDLMESRDPQIARLRVEMDKLSEEKNLLLNDQSSSSDKIAVLDEQVEAKKNEYLRTLLADQRQRSGGSVLDQTLLDQLRESRLKEEFNLYLLKNREKLYREQVERYRRENPKLVERAIEEARIKRSKGVYENLYSILLEKGEEARIKSATGTGGISIIDEPVLPARPVPSQVPHNLALGLVLGLGFGLGLALAVEYFDNTIRTQQEITQKLGLTVMGAIPEKSSINMPVQRKVFNPMSKSKISQQSLRGATVNKNGYHDNLLYALRQRDPFVDAYHTLRTNLQFASVDKAIRSLLITSSFPGEGKTLSSANLAISFAEFGKRVLLIDADLRKPKQQDIFNIKKSPGLSDFLVRELNPEQIFYPTRSENLKIVPCGTMPPNPLEMVSSQRMAEFMTMAQNMFDLVIVDSPPVQVVSDAMPLSTMVSHVLLVVKFGKTLLRDVQETMNILQHVKAPLLGVIFNSIKVSSGYGYSYKYNYYYGAQGQGKKKEPVRVFQPDNGSAL